MSVFSQSFFLEKQADDEKLDHAQETALALQFQQGDIGAYKELRRSYQPLINRWVQRWKSGSDKVSTTQLKMAAEWAFPHLVMKYDPNQATALRSWLTTGINGHLQNEAGDAVLGPYASRQNHAEIKRFETAIKEATMEFGPRPTKTQIMKYLPTGYTNEEYERMQRFMHTTSIGDAVTQGEDDDSPLRFRDQFTGVSVLDHPDERLHDMTLDRIEEVMRRRLTPQEYATIRGRVIEDKSMSQVGLEQHMSSTKLRSIISRWNEIKKEEGLI